MGKGGGGIDTSGLEQAAAEATALQERIYNLSREDIQPYYDVGTASLGRLSDLLGLGGGSVKTREQLMRELTPQYTSQIAGTPSDQLLFMGVQGTPMTADAIRNSADFATPNRSGARGSIEVAMRSGDDQHLIDTLAGLGYTPFNYSPAREEINYEGLNAAVDERLANQGAPDDYGSLLERFNLEKFEQDPSYQFRQDEARKALERSLAAQGVTLGGAGYGELNPMAARLLNEQTQNLASQEYGQAYDRYNIDRLNTYNMLMGTTGIGQTATGQLTGAGQNYATNVGNLQTGLASAQMNAQIAQASQPSMFSQLIPAAAQLGSTYLMSDRSMKENMEKVGNENGFNLYKFNYKGNIRTFIGVMADEVKKIIPEAVIRNKEGYDMVNYDLIGVQMREA